MNRHVIGLLMMAVSIVPALAAEQIVDRTMPLWRRLGVSVVRNSRTGSPADRVLGVGAGVVGIAGLGLLLMR